MGGLQVMQVRPNCLLVDQQPSIVWQILLPACLTVGEYDGDDASYVNKRNFTVSIQIALLNEESFRLLAQIIIYHQHYVGYRHFTVMIHVAHLIFLKSKPEDFRLVLLAAASIEVIRNCYETAREKKAVIPVIPIVETVRHLQGGHSVTVPRNEYLLVHTPQTFDIQLLKAAILKYM